MSKTGNPAEKRQFGRRQTNLRGWISVPGRPKLPCIVRNISEGGALLELDKPSWLPYNFQLTIEATGLVSPCEVRHNTPSAVGVRFLETIEIADVTPKRASDNRSLNEQASWMGDER